MSVGHDRKLVLSGVSLTAARLKSFKPWLVSPAVRDELEKEMIDSEYLSGAPFKWVGLILRFGLVDEIEPHYAPINAKHGDLPLAIELDTNRLMGASPEKVAEIFRKATLRALVHAGQKYGLNTARLHELLAEAEASAS